MKLLFDTHFGSFVAVDMLTPGSEHTVVSVDKDRI